MSDLPASVKDAVLKDFVGSLKTSPPKKKAAPALASAPTGGFGPGNLNVVGGKSVGFPVSKVLKVAKATPATASPIPVVPLKQNPTPPSAPMPAPTGSNITREVRLIYSDVVGNNNKVWYGALYANGDVYTEWGRVGKAMQTKTYPGAGSRKLDEKEREKLNKGYTVARVVASVAGGTSAPVQNANLQDIAIKQISRGEPVLDRLVRMLVKANIHQITSQSQITYNNTTGLFQTPLGVVTSDAIAEAYHELDAIAQALLTGKLTDTRTLNRISQYLRLIPQDFGMKLDVRAMFPDQKAIQKQKDLLDSLEASYNAIKAAKNAPAADPKASKKDVDDKVFEVNVKVCADAEVARIRKLYAKTKQSMHRYVADMDVKTAYEIEMPSQRARFEAHGRPLGNVWELWHGTKLANVLNILRVGLRITPPKGTSIAGAMFSSGLYFSDQSSKSLNYATNFWHGGGRGHDDTFFMFLANVAMGKYMVPRGPTSSRPPSGYHSYYAKAGQSGVQNNEMIIQSENQFDLIRLVEFTERGR